MIASRTDAARLPRVAWRRDAKRSLSALLAFLEARGFADSEGRRQQIEQAVESLRYAPLRCRIVGKLGRLTVRQLVVDRRFLVFYVYTPPRGMSSGGTVSIRAVKHAASETPFLGVREGTGQPATLLTTRDSAAEPAVTA